MAQVVRRRAIAEDGLDARPEHLRHVQVDRPDGSVVVDLLVHEQARRQEHLECQVSTLIDFTPTSENEEAGLTVLADNLHHCELAVTLIGGKRCVIVRRRIGSLSAEVACTEIPQDEGPVELAIHADKTTYRFLAGTPGSLKELATAETRYVSTQVAGGYTGVYFGLYGTASGQESNSKAFIDWFEYRSAG